MSYVRRVLWCDRRLARSRNGRLELRSRTPYESRISRRGDLRGPRFHASARSTRLSKSPPQSGKLVQFKAKPSRGRDPEVASTEQPECPQCASLRAACDELRVRTDDALKALPEERA